MCFHKKTTRPTIALPFALFLPTFPLMPRPLPKGGLPLLWNHGRPQSSLHPRQQAWTWTAVIQLSARHLFCSAHAPVPPPSRPFALALANSPASKRLSGRQRPRSHVPRSTRALRNISTATVVDMDLRSSYSEQESLDCPRAGSASTTSPPVQTSISNSTATSPVEKTGDTSREAWSTPSTSASADDSLRTWTFPTTKGHGPAERVHSWHSTSKALSRLYESLHNCKSTMPSSPHLSTTPVTVDRSVGSVELVMVYYNYLSRLQATHDTILIPRRDTRALFLLQGREPKTIANLKQLLRIASDLIWLNDKQRRRRRQTASSNISTSGVSDSERSKGTISGTRSDNYHGLRVSEYTILMDWIGSTKQLAAVRESEVASLSGSHQGHFTVPDDNQAPPKYGSRSLPRSEKCTFEARHRNPNKHEPHIDKAWAIWQDFSMTGMKADVVLCTTLLDSLLKAGDFDRADQIWKYLQPTKEATPSPPLTSSAQKLNEMTSGSGTMADTHDPTSILDGVSKTLSGVADAVHPASSTSIPSTVLLAPASSKAGVLPNLQTLSVLMQAHVRDRDLAGVARVYQEVLQRQKSSNDQHPRHPHQPRSNHMPYTVNSTLLNQVLAVLLDLGETAAAKEIYTQTRAEQIERDQYTTNQASQSRPGSTETFGEGPTGLPMHQQAFHRRSDWKRRNPRSLPDAAPQPPHPPVALLPDSSTVSLVLRYARQAQDWEWEAEILKDCTDAGILEELE